MLPLFAHQIVRAQASYISGTTYIGGYNVKCNGQSTASIKAIPSFGTPPYTFLWNTGETTTELLNKPAGIYTVIISDSNQVTHADTFEIKQPYVLGYQSTLTDYHGFNIDAHGAHTGGIILNATGGTPPYRYTWNTGDSIANLRELTAGAYAFVITDANQCSTSGNITLTEPNPIQVSFSNIENLTCFKSDDGKATLSVNGGLGNFSAVWDNGSFSLSPEDLHAGFNAVRIFEHGTAVLDTGITLTQPDEIDIQFTYSDYNGYGVSCTDCFNGTIASTVTGGTAPFTYAWDDANNSTTAGLSNLNGDKYLLKVIDANGCKAGNTAILTMPTSKDWSRFGNANIDTSMFIGSTDTSALVFKVNNTEGMVINSNNISFKSKLVLENLPIKDSSETLRMLGLSNDGTVKSFGSTDYDLRPDENQTWMCAPNGGLTPWQHPTLWNTTTNQAVGPQVTTEIITCPDLNVGIGVMRVGNNIKLNVRGKIKFDNELLYVNPLGYGKVGIGTNQPAERFHVEGKTWLNGNVHIGDNASPVSKLAVEGIVYAREFHVNEANNWPDYVFAKNYPLMPIAALKAYLNENKHLPDMPPAALVEKEGYDLNATVKTLTKQVEELHLYIIQLKEELDAVKGNKH